MTPSPSTSYRLNVQRSLSSRLPRAISDRFVTKSCIRRTHTPAPRFARPLSNSDSFPPATQRRQRLNNPLQVAHLADSRSKTGVYLVVCNRFDHFSLLYLSLPVLSYFKLYVSHLQDRQQHSQMRHLRRVRGSHLMFDNNFAKCGPIFKILSPIDSRENSLRTHYKDFRLTCNILLHYLVKFENPKMIQNFHVERDN